MRTIAFLSCSIVFASASLMGCVGGDEPVEDDLSPPLETLQGPGVNNGLIPSCLADQAIRRTIEDLARDGIAREVDQSGMRILRRTPDIPVTCRKIVQDLVECALGDEQSVIDRETDTVYYGSVGLAKEWVGLPLSASESRWVSACMIQHLNYFGMVVPILLEGDHPAIAQNPERQQEYPFQESTAWGDLFNPPANGSIGWICTEMDVWSTCPEDLGGPWIDTRVCDGVANCGIQFVGRCEQNCTRTATGGWDCSAQYGYTETVRARMQTNTHPPILGPCR